MSRKRVASLLPVLGLASILISACTSSDDVGFRSSAASSVQPRLATWQCTGGASLTVTSVATGLLVSDSRGVEVDLPPDPPGQRERFGKTGYAMVFDGRTASWFAAGKPPVDCKR